MHRGERLRFQRGQSLERAICIKRVRHIFRQRSRHARKDGLPRAVDDTRLDQGFGVAGLKEEVGTQKRSVSLLEEKPCVPAMRDVRRRQVT